MTKYNLITIIFLFVICLIIMQLSWYKALDNIVYDKYLELNRVTHKENQIVIIKIDQQSIEKLGKWPWSRQYYIDILKELFKNQAKVVGLDLQFNDPMDTDIDNSFHELLKATPTVILDIIDFKNKTDNNSFWVNFKKDLNVGHNIFSVDPDGTIRKQYLLLNNKPAFALIILSLFDKDKFHILYETSSVKLKHLFLLNNNNKPVFINYKRHYNAYPQYSFVDVLENKVPASVFKDKIVLIGETLENIPQNYKTPFSAIYNYTGTTYSVYLQAQLIDSLLNFDPIKKVDEKILYLFLFVFILSGLYFVKSVNIINQILILFLIIPLLLLCATFFLFKYQYLWFSPTIFLFSSVVIFIAISVNTTFNISDKLDKYINELSVKTDLKSNKMDDISTVDQKLSTLVRLTNLIEKDKVVLETVLTSVNSVIILFDDLGELLYSNKSSCQVSEEHIKEIFKNISMEDIREQAQNNNIFKQNLSFKNNHYEFIATAAGNQVYVGILNDITDVVNIAEMKSTILRMLSHEMKTPLASILFCSDYMQELNQDDSISSYIVKIGNQTEYLQDLIDQFLSLNKMEVADFQINKQPINIIQFIDTIISSLSVLSEKKNINIINVQDGAISETIMLDPNYTWIAFKNIIDNAIKYSPENTTITISCVENDHYLNLSIKDQGFGISKEDLEKIFDKFFRVKTSKTKGIHGTGLGLSFVKKIIELHDGSISINSEVDKGTEFIILLPV